MPVRVRVHGILELRQLKIILTMIRLGATGLGVMGGRLESLSSGLHNIGNTEIKEMSLLSNHCIFATTTWIASLT